MRKLKQSGDFLAPHVPTFSRQPVNLWSLPSLYMKWLHCYRRPPTHFILGPISASPVRTWTQQFSTLRSSGFLFTRLVPLTHNSKIILLTSAFCQLLLNFFSFRAKLNSVVCICSHQFFSTYFPLNNHSGFYCRCATELALVKVTSNFRAAKSSQ